MWPQFGIELSSEPIDLARLFNGLPVILEIGSGMGEATAELAARQPHIAILAVDVHTPGIATLARRCEEQELTNVRAVIGDAIDVLTDMIRPESLAGVRAFFPDPWPKARHTKRRLIRPDLVDLLASRIAPRGFLHTATDWPDYADQMLSVLDDCPLLQIDGESAPSRPLTRYERIAIEQGRRSWDFYYLKRSGT